MKEGDAAPATPLQGIRVLEVGSFLAGPYCGMQLADLGADVVKIEPPGSGDHLRSVGPFIEGESSSFLRVNRNKRSLAIDLTDPEGGAAFRLLIKRADVVVENLRPGAMRDLGFDYEALSAINSRLVYVAISGWGQVGPLAHLPGLDIMAQARSGLMSITGEPEGAPVKVGVPICDLVCGLYGAIAAMAALRLREITGVGHFVDVNLFESGVSLSVWEAARFFATGEVPRRHGSAHQAIGPYQAIRCSDGWFTVGVSTPRQWTSFCRAIDLGRLEKQPEYIDANARRTNREALIEEIERVTRSRTMSHWISVFENEGVPCAPINDYSQVFADPHLAAREFLWDATTPQGGKVRQLGSAVRFKPDRTVHSNAGPPLGFDSHNVLAEIGYSDEDIARLDSKGVINSTGRTRAKR